jgi:hypothetical protein
MTGDCGVFYIDDRQIGGCYEWETDAKIIPQSCGKWKAYKILNSSIKTNKWWLFEDAEQFRVELYWLRGDRLVLANDRDVKKILYAEDMELGKEQNHELLMWL